MTNPQIDEYGIKRCHNEKGQLHREDGPAVEWIDGDKFWFINDQLHREDGPAVEHRNGHKFWYLYGQRLSFEEWQRQVIIQNAKSLL